MQNESLVQWLKHRKISQEVLEQFNISCDRAITIPVTDPDGSFLFNKYRRDPFLPPTGQKYWYDAGSSATLFGAEFIKDEKVVVVTEGELDALVLWSHNIPAVSSTSGALTFKEEWVALLKDKEVFLCYDNDKTGATGSVHTLSLIPQAKVILLPIDGGIKDVTDYYMRGGDLRDLMATARHYVEVSEVEKDMRERKGMWLPTIFHEAWFEWYEGYKNNERIPARKKAQKQGDDVTRAKSVPIDSIIKTNHQRKALCLFHKEKTPSMHVFPDNHFYCFSCGARGDVIDIVKELHHMDFKRAVEWLNSNA